MFRSEGGWLMLASAANGEETEGEIAMGIDADIRRTGDGYKTLVDVDGKGIAIGR